MFRLWNNMVNIVVVLFAGGFLVLVLGSLEAGTSTNFTCVLCRLGRTETTLLVGSIRASTRTNAAGGIQNT